MQELVKRRRTAFLLDARDPFHFGSEIGLTAAAREVATDPPFDLPAFPPRSDLGHDPNGGVPILISVLLVEVPRVVEGQFGTRRTK